MSNGGVIEIVDLVWNQTVHGCVFAAAPITLIRGDVYEVVYSTDKDNAKVEVVFSSNEIKPAAFVLPAGGVQKILVSPEAISADLGKTAVAYTLNRSSYLGKALLAWKPYPRPPEVPPNRPDVEIDDPGR